MQGWSRGRTPGLLREVAFSSWSLPLLITVSLISIVSCGDGAKNPDQEASANGTPVEQHSGPIVETKVDQGTSGRIDPEVSTKTPNSTQSDQADTASQDSRPVPHRGSSLTKLTVVARYFSRLLSRFLCGGSSGCSPFPITSKRCVRTIPIVTRRRKNYFWPSKMRQTNCVRCRYGSMAT